MSDSAPEHEEFSSAAVAEAKKLFAGPCTFIAGVARLDQLPPLGLPEIAFAGRSNVGKSSLINALTGRKMLARTSHTPGRTQQLNFFDLGGALHLVDLPGYGYAKVSKAQRKMWNSLIKDYLRGRTTLRCVFMLVDARHGLKDSDREIMKLLDEAAVSYRVVMTKSDKTKQSHRDKIRAATTEELKKHGAAMPDILWSSAHKFSGIDELKALAYRFSEQ